MVLIKVWFIGYVFYFVVCKIFRGILIILNKVFGLFFKNKVLGGYFDFKEEFEVMVSF